MRLHVEILTSVKLFPDFALSWPAERILRSHDQIRPASNCRRSISLEEIMAYKNERAVVESPLNETRGYFRVDRHFYREAESNAIENDRAPIREVQK
jgi:hypothetical protein